jgi:GNAT superfamily N-acetyltransferase
MIDPARPTTVRVDANSAERVEELSDLAVRTFCQTFAEHNTPADTQAFIDEHISPDALAAKLGNPEHHAYVLEIDGRAVGYYYLIRNSANGAVAARSPIELSKLYVDAPAHRSGLGRAMMHELLDRSRQWGHDRLWLSVWEHNHRAKAFYSNYPFETAGTWEYPVGTKIDTDEIWVLEL